VEVLYFLQTKLEVFMVAFAGVVVAGYFLALLCGGLGEGAWVFGVLGGSRGDACEDSFVVELALGLLTLGLVVGERFSSFPHRRDWEPGGR